MWVSKCEIADEFSSRSYKPSPDGVFSFKIENPETIQFDDVKSLRLMFSGTWMPKV